MSVISLMVRERSMHLEHCEIMALNELTGINTNTMDQVKTWNAFKHKNIERGKKYCK